MSSADGGEGGSQLFAASRLVLEPGIRLAGKIGGDDQCGVGAR